MLHSEIAIFLYFLDPEILSFDYEQGSKVIKCRTNDTEFLISASKVSDWLNGIGAIYN
jgi:hypothetical protein